MIRYSSSFLLITILLAIYGPVTESSSELEGRSGSNSPELPLLQEVHVSDVIATNSNSNSNSARASASDDPDDGIDLLPQNIHGSTENHDSSTSTHTILSPSNLRSQSSNLNPTDPSTIAWPWGNHTNACSNHPNCTACTSASITCHWCTSDQQCHAKGSWHGCAYGATCPKNDTDDDSDSCKSHKDCTECTLSSKLCHWCAFDNQCHAIGSLYGCKEGVNCYSNDRCKRKEPEIIQEGIWDGIGVIPLVLIGAAAFCSLCCVSVMFISVTAFKGAFDSYQDVMDNENDNEIEHGDRDAYVDDGGSTSTSTHLHASAPPLEAFSLHDRSHNAEYADEENENDENDDDTHEKKSLLETSKSMDGDGDTHPQTTSSPLDGSNHSNHSDGHGQTQTSQDSKLSPEAALVEPLVRTEQAEGEVQSQSLVTAHPSPSRIPRSARTRTRMSQNGNGRTRRNSYMNCLFGSCKVWLLFMTITVVLSTIATILYFPKIPTYNICSDEMAWNSIIRGLTSLKMKASFEVLMSVENDNRLDIVLEDFVGKMKHDGNDAGTWSFPTTTIGATSITDTMLTITLIPSDKWQAISIISDYYKDELEFFVDVTGLVKIKGIGFTIPVQENDIYVKVNDPDMKDRHLCACPEWKDLAPTASPVVSSFEEAVADPASLHRAVDLAKLSLSLPMTETSQEEEGDGVKLAIH